MLLFAQTVPLDDPFIQTADRLEAKGLLQGLPDTRPYTLQDLKEALERGGFGGASRADAFDMERLMPPAPMRGFAPALRLETSETSFELWGALRASYRPPDTLRFGPEIRYHGSIRWFSFSATHRFTYAGNWPDTVFDAHSWRGEERPVFAEIPDARLDLDFDWLHLQVGRSQMQFGPVPEGGLMLSTQPWGLDHAAYTLRWRGVRFTSMYAWLQTDKRMVVHRFEYVASRWKLGLSEGVVSADTNDIFPYLAAPVAFYYIMQWNKWQDENILWSADATVLFPPVRFYAELLVDDFAYEPATGPHKVGGTIGSEWVSILASEVDLRADYTAISKWTYAQRHVNQNYTFRGRILGDDLGPDADRTRLVLTWRIVPRLSLKLKGYYERHGEGDVWHDFADDGAHDRETYHPPFPSGVVERRLGAEAGLRCVFLGRSFISLKGGVENVVNTDHVEGATETRPVLESDIYWEF